MVRGKFQCFPLLCHWRGRSGVSAAPAVPWGRTPPTPLPGCCSVTSTSALPVGSTQPSPTLCSWVSRGCSCLVGGKIAKAVLLTPVMDYTQCNGDGASPLRGQTPTVKGHGAQCRALLCSASEGHCWQPYLAFQNYS